LHSHADVHGTMAQDQLLIRRWQLPLLAFFTSQTLQFSLNWPLISSFSAFSFFLSYSGFILSVWPVFSRPVVSPPPFPSLHLLTLLLITKRAGAISEDLHLTPVPLSIHPLPSVAISPSLLPSLFLVKSRFVWDTLGEQRQQAAAVLRKVTVMYGLQRCHQGQACLGADTLNTHAASSIVSF